LTIEGAEMPEKDKKLKHLAARMFNPALAGLNLFLFFPLAFVGFSEVMESLLILGFSGLIGFLDSSEIG
jgi:hypothetical protein